MRPGTFTMPETVRAGGPRHIPEACPYGASGGPGGVATIVMLMPAGRLS